MTWFSPWLSSHAYVITLWIGTLCTLGLYSILYKENEVYRLFEHIYLGLATGFLIANTWTDVLLPKWWTPMWGKGDWPPHGRPNGEWTWILATVVGLFYYLIYSEKLNWLARVVIGFFLGVASGQQFQTFVNDVWPQVPASFKPLIPHAKTATAAALNVPDAINNLIFVLILLCVMSYFFFSIEHRSKLLKGASKSGRWMLMFAFGAIFGSTIMGRLALLIDRMDFVINIWGGTLTPSSPDIGRYMAFGGLFAIVAILLFLAMRNPQTDNQS